MSTPSVLSACTKAASHPFDKVTADMILRSSDNIDFRVRRSILAEASSVFEDMLTVPQPHPESSNGDELKDGLPVIRLTEPGVVLDKLLRLCYPVDDPELASLEELKPVLQAAQKYMMQESTSLLRKRLVKLGQAQPLRALAIACSLGLEREADCLAPLAYSIIGTFMPELREISAGVYYRVAHYGSQTLTKYAGLGCRQDARRAPLSSTQSRIAHLPDARHGHVIPQELLHCPTADVVITTSDGIDFSLQSMVIAIGSPGLYDLLPHSVTTANVASIRISEDSRTFSALLRYIYPLAQETPPSLDTLHSLLAAAQRYKVPSALSALQQRLASHLILPGLSKHSDRMANLNDILRVFALAHRFNFPAERAAAARALLQLSNHELQDLYVEELEDIDAAAYFRLLEYHEKCAQGASACVFSLALASYTGPGGSPGSACPSPPPKTPERISPKTRAHHYQCPPTSSSSETSSPPSPALITTKRGHGPACHVLLDDTSAPSWAHYRTHSAPRWWIMYLYKLAVVLRERPWARIALDRSLRQRAVARALECQPCRTAFVPGFQDFVEGIVEEVERAVGKVVLEL